MAVTSGRGCAGRSLSFHRSPEPVKIIRPSKEERKNVIRKAMAELGYEPPGKQSCLLVIRAPLLSFSLLPQKKSMENSSIWKAIPGNQPLL